MALSASSTMHKDRAYIVLYTNIIRKYTSSLHKQRKNPPRRTPSQKQNLRFILRRSLANV